MPTEPLPPVDIEGRRRRVIAAWLFAVAAMVFVMIVLGGLTRLTQSGLSMVDWRPLTGWLPPTTTEEWEAVFARYRAYPEYQKRNIGMTLTEFQSIFWLEYVHRLWGRLIGAAFALPLAVFLVRRWVDRRLAWRLVGLFVLGGLQGVLGWVMVKSGLVDKPDVSQYRLAAHLGLALVIMAAIGWVAMALLRPAPAVPDAGARRLGRWAAGLLALVFATAISGAFVAGLDAGLTYNTFPLMDGELVPSGLFDMAPAWVNLFDNVTTVQFDHRLLAMATLAAVLAFWWRTRRSTLAPGQRRAAGALAAAVVVQVGLGISTLVLVVPVALAALHQAGAVVVLATALWAVFELFRPART